jgi:hypothetical protein
VLAGAVIAPVAGGGAALAGAVFAANKVYKGDVK